MRKPYIRLLLVAVVALGALPLSACGETITTRVFPITRELPAREEARYRLLDSKGAQIGTSVLTITTEGDGLRLGLAYEFGGDRTDTGSVIVQRDSMKPVRAERTVVDGDRRYVTRAEYDATGVTVAFDDGRRARERKAPLSESAYDNLESLFLWRTIDLSVGAEVRYVNVVIDPRSGTISRALGTVEVIGREEVRLPSGTVPAWRVQFRSAGVVNTAWYRADDTRALVRYDITRGPTLILDSVTP